MPLSDPVTGRPSWRLATWNVLAQAFCHPDRYLDVSPVALEPERRRAAVVAEVSRRVVDVDVVCLQEVDAALVEELGVAGVWVHAEFHDGGDHAVALASRTPRSTLGGDLGGGRSWAGVELRDAPEGEPGAVTVVVSCHLQHPGDGPVGANQAAELVAQLRKVVLGAAVAIGADVNAVAGGPATEAFAGLGLEVHQPTPTAWVRGTPRTTDVLALPPGGRVTDVVGPTGPIPTPDWPSDHRLLAGAWLRR